MSLWLWNRLDDAAHFLYCPTSLGKGAARYRWHHRIHLIPRFALGHVCDGYDRALGVFDD